MLKSGTPIYRLYNSQLKDHAYTSKPGRVGLWIRKGYRLQGVPFYQKSGYQVRVYRLTKRIGSNNIDNFYTASAHEALMAIRDHGYKIMGTAFRAKCFGACESAQDKSVNIHRFYSGTAHDHFYSVTGR